MFLFYLWYVVYYSFLVFVPSSFALHLMLKSSSFFLFYYCFVKVIYIYIYLIDELLFFIITFSRVLLLSIYVVVISVHSLCGGSLFVSIALFLICLFCGRNITFVLVIFVRVLILFYYYCLPYYLFASQNENLNL